MPKEAVMRQYDKPALNATANFELNGEAAQTTVKVTLLVPKGQLWTPCGLRKMAWRFTGAWREACSFL